VVVTSLKLRTLAKWSINDTQKMKFVIKPIRIIRAIQYVSCINNYGTGTKDASHVFCDAVTHASSFEYEGLFLLRVKEGIGS
jgi:hypothetical protein